MKRLNACIDRLMAEGKVNHIAIRVSRNDTVLADTFRSVSQPLDEQTLFDMASVSKILATTTISLIAKDRGLLDFEDPVSKFFPCPAEKREMTLRHLLTHTMGIGHKALNLEGNTYDNIAEFILNIPSDVAIGTETVYSCPGFILLGKILENVFGKPLNLLLTELITEPLGMTRTGYLPTETVNIVNSNAWTEQPGIVNDYNCRFLGRVAGNAGVFSCLADMSKFVNMLLNCGAPLFRREIYDLAVQNYTPTMSESRALGFLYADERYAQTGGLFPNGSFGHCGHTGQSVFLDPQTGLSVIILSDMTVSLEKQGNGSYRYEEVMQARHDLHNAIRQDLHEK